MPETMTLLDRILLVVVSILIGVVLASNPKMEWLSHMDMGDLVQGIATTSFLAAIVWMHRGGKSVVENNTQAMNAVVQEMRDLNGTLEYIEENVKHTRDQMEKHRREFAGVHGAKQ